MPSAGLTAVYYDELDFSGKSITRTDPTINFNWSQGAPAAGIAPDTFSVRWTGTLTPKFSERYTFHATTDDGVRLWVNGQLVIDHWRDQPTTERTGTVTLQAGKPVPIRMEYYEQHGGATAVLKWSSKLQKLEVVPETALSPATTVAGALSDSPRNQASDALRASRVGFPVFDAVRSKGKPALHPHGLMPIYVAGWELYASTWREFEGKDASVPDEAAVRALARRVARSGQILVLNIEHLPLDIRRADERDVLKSMSVISNTVDWVRDEAPDLRIGLYSFLPLFDYGTIVRYHTALEDRASGVETWHSQRLAKFETEYKAWERANSFLSPLAARMDVIFPSLYTQVDNADWLKYATATVREASKYGKPVYVFLWPLIDVSRTDGVDVPVSQELWRLQLETSRKIADGAVVWTGSWQRWGDDDPWWHTLRAFLSSTGAE